MTKQQRYHKKYAKHIGLALRYATKENLAEIAEIIQFRNRDFAGEIIEAMKPANLSDFLREMDGKENEG